MSNVYPSEPLSLSSMRTTAPPPFPGARISVCLPRPSTPANLKFAGFGGNGPVHSNRRHCGGCPERFRSTALSPRISTSAAPSTTTSTVHLPRFGSPPDLYVARRSNDWAFNRPNAVAATNKKREYMHHPQLVSPSFSHAHTQTHSKRFRYQP